MFPHLERTLCLLSLINLFALFAWITVRERSRQACLWAIGWFAAVAQSGSQLLHALQWISGPVSLWLGYGTAGLAAAAFIASVCPATGAKRLRGMLPLILPLAALPVWLVWGRSEPLISLLDFAVFAGFAAAAVCCRGSSERASPGIWLTSFSLLAWALVYPAVAVCRSLQMAVSGEEAVWDIPKYFVAFGMMVWLLENHALKLQAEVCERQAAEQSARSASEAKSV